MKFSALNVNFSCPSPDPLSSRFKEACVCEHQRGYLPKSGYFTAISY